VGNNLNKHSKDPGFRAIYKLSQIEKQNEELIKQNNELVKAYNELNQKLISLQRSMYLMLYELGGSIDIDHKEFASVEGKIMANVDEEKGITTFFIMGPDEI
jgi:hypothetical protein